MKRLLLLAIILLLCCGCTFAGGFYVNCSQRVDTRAKYKDVDRELEIEYKKSPDAETVEALAAGVTSAAIEAAKKGL